MKQSNAFKNLFLASFMGASLMANGQTVHPLAFGPTVTGNPSNFYKDYVGERLEVTLAPTGYSSILGNKIYTTSNNGDGGAGNWGGFVTTPIVNDTVVMAMPDTFGCSAFTNSMTGKIALIWRGPESGACEFGYKALQAQMAGAVAVVIINEYTDQGPVGMAAGASGASVTIPVFMIGNQDGAAISAAYDAGGEGSVKMTITPWGLLNQNDLGFVPGGYGIWHDNAIPFSQLTGESLPDAYYGVNGAFIANYGTDNETHVKLTSSTTFTPSGGSAIPVHSDSETLASFPELDSIWAFYGTEYHNVGASVTGKGVFNTTYTISSDSADQYPEDNSLTYSFYATDSIFSKGRYDLVNNVPIVDLWYQPGNSNYLWGVPYYVAKGGSAAKTVQVSVSAGPGLLTNGAAVNILIFKWVDAATSSHALDSTIESDELTIVGGGSYAFNGTTDSSFDIFNVPIYVGDSVVGQAVPSQHPALDSNSWYLVAADMEVTDNSNDLAVGCDGELDAYPRTFFRRHATGYQEFYCPSVDSDWVDLKTTALATASWGSYTYAGSNSYYSELPFPIDSICYSQQIGLIPALPMIVTPYLLDTTTVVDTISLVNNVSPAAIQFTVYPNPASDLVNVSLQLTTAAKRVSYTIIDGSARVVNRQIHTNVQLSDTYSYSTGSLPSGNYTMLVTVDGKLLYKKFTVVKQ